MRVGTFQLHPVPEFFLTVISLQSLLKVSIHLIRLRSNSRAIPPIKTHNLIQNDKIKSEKLMQGLQVLQGAAAAPATAAAAASDDIESLRAQVVRLQVTHPLALASPLFTSFPLKEELAALKASRP